MVIMFNVVVWVRDKVRVSCRFLCFQVTKVSSFAQRVSKNRCLFVRIYTRGVGMSLLWKDEEKNVNNAVAVSW